jgi:hypothetical protein
VEAVATGEGHAVVVTAHHLEAYGALNLLRYDETNPRPRAATTPDVLDHGDATRFLYQSLYGYDRERFDDATTLTDTTRNDATHDTLPTPTTTHAPKRST